MSPDSMEPPPPPLRSKHTSNFPALLDELGASVLVTTYQTGRYESVAEPPGFTRGLDIHGSLAFVGLSQVRESAVFRGIPIAERALAERNCAPEDPKLISDSYDLPSVALEQAPPALRTPAPLAS